MKRILGLMFALLLSAMPSAWAQDNGMTPREGPAVATPENLYETVPLFDTIDDGGNVLMEYYSGAQLEVTRVIGNGMVQVQAGTSGASIMGYMREGDLRYGVLAMRDVQQCITQAQVESERPIYAYCDEQAAVIGRTNWEMTYTAMGKNGEGWVQLCDHSGGTGQEGFLYLPEGAGELRAMFSWAVQPAPGELTAQEAYAAAIDCLLDNPGLYAMQKLPEELRTREGLMSMDAQVRMVHDWSSKKTYWDVYLQNGEDYESNVYVLLTPEGELSIAEHGNG
ncbi:MAG: hypothetical protein Q4G52_11765 [Clostridia bacterium]|nr:hypothetical protein [Clostridia bacterium]